jgi:hypothetical protein
VVIRARGGSKPRLTVLPDISVLLQPYCEIRQSLGVEIGSGNTVDNDAMLDLLPWLAYVRHRWSIIELDDIRPAARQGFPRSVWK